MPGLEIHTATGPYCCQQPHSPVEDVTRCNTAGPAKGSWPVWSGRAAGGFPPSPGTLRQASLGEMQKRPLGAGPAVRRGDNCCLKLLGEEQMADVKASEPVISVTGFYEQSRVILSDSTPGVVRG